MKTITILDINCIESIMTKIEKANLDKELKVIASDCFEVTDEVAEKLKDLLPYADWEISNK